MRKRLTALHHNSAPYVEAHQTGATGFNFQNCFLHRKFQSLYESMFPRVDEAEIGLME
jgi:hypothetical protein